MISYKNHKPATVNGHRLTHFYQTFFYLIILPLFLEILLDERHKSVGCNYPYI